MADGRPLAAFALATFHTTVLVLAFVAVGFVGGDFGGTLEDLNTLAGLGIFAVLWGVTGYCTWRAIQPLSLGRSAPIEVLGRAVIWGGVNGTLFFWSLLAIGLAGVAVSDPGSMEPLGVIVVPLVFGAIGGAVAFAAGVVVGGTFAFLDLALLEVTAMLVRPDVPAEMLVESEGGSDG